MLKDGYHDHPSGMGTVTPLSREKVGLTLIV